MAFHTQEILFALAWPAVEEATFGPFLARQARGFSKRANSALLIGEADCFALSASNVFSTYVRPIEAWYASRNLPAIFRLTDDCSGTFDVSLEQHGYAKEGISLVMEADIAESITRIEHIMPVASSGVAEKSCTCGNWLELEGQLTGRPSEHTALLTDAFGENSTQSDYIVLEPEQDGQGETGAPVACGQGICLNGLCALFSIYTSPAHRRQGLGLQVIYALLKQAQARGVQAAWLQVMKSNFGAQRLYHAAGFEERYTYWYRVQQSHRSTNAV